jgi:hypothetical protein
VRCSACGRSLSHSPSSSLTRGPNLPHRAYRGLFVSFLKERGRSTADLAVVDLSFGVVRSLWSAPVRRRCPGSTGGRSGSGRGPWTRTLCDAGLIRRRRASWFGLRACEWVVGVCCSIAGSPASGQAVVACRSFLRRAGRHGVGATGAAGRGQSSGGDHADRAGGQTQHDPRPAAARMPHAEADRLRRMVPSRSA